MLFGEPVLWVRMDNTKNRLCFLRLVVKSLKEEIDSAVKFSPFAIGDIFKGILLEASQTICAIIVEVAITLTFLKRLIII